MAGRRPYGVGAAGNLEGAAAAAETHQAAVAAIRELQ